jgi:O-methyltransferase involved in polyketide biosynthesis
MLTGNCLSSTLPAARSLQTAGYLGPDPWLERFVPEGDRRMQPALVHHCTLERVSCVQGLVRRFLGLAAPAHPQVVIVGAGMDSLALNELGMSDAAARDDAIFVEVDLPDIVASKAAAIRRADPSLEAFGVRGEVTDLGAGIITPRYRLLSADIRDLVALERALVGAGVGFDQPSLVVLECVLGYLEPQQAQEFLRWVIESFAVLG